jgi:hypothetical protein
MEIGTLFIGWEIEDINQFPVFSVPVMADTFLYTCSYCVTRSSCNTTCAFTVVLFVSSPTLQYRVSIHSSHKFFPYSLSFENSL